MSMSEVPQTIRKSNDLIQARYRLSLSEQRLVLHLAGCISSEDEDFKDYDIRIVDFARMFGLEKCKAIYQEVEDACTALVGKKLELSSPEKRIYAAWLSYAEYIEGSGLVRVRFDKSLKPYLLQLQGHFTQYHLSHVVNFKGQYSIRLYELLKMKAYTAVKGKFNRSFEIEDFREILGIQKNEYRIFSNLRRKVIEPAIEEISKSSDLIIEDIIYNREGKKIKELNFIARIREFEPNSLLEHSEEIQKETSHPIIDRLTSLGFAIGTAHKYKTRYGIKRIERNIAYVIAKQQAGLVKDVPAFLNQAIQDDLGSAWEVVTQQQAVVNEQQTAKRKQQETQADLAHLQKMAELAGVPLEDLLPKKGGKKVRKT